MGSNKKPRWAITIPVLIFFVTIMLSIFWLSNFFEGLGLSNKNTYYINITVIVTFLIGYYSGILQSKLK